MSTPNPFLVAGAPEFIVILQAAQTFVKNLGTDPTKLPITAGPALQVFLGTAGLQIPALANAEFGVVQSGAISQLGNAIEKIQAATSAAASSGTAASSQAS
jgi:membrane carboxypeptidase/penicillin-binding protein PbpC